MPARSFAPDQLDFQRRLLEAIVESTVDAILVVSMDREVVYFNDNFLAMWGLSAELVAAGDSVLLVTAVSDKLIDPEGFAARANYLYDHPLETSHEELLFRDGRVLERFSGPVTDDAGKAQGRVWFFRDVTEERRAKAASDILALSGELLAESARCRTDAQRAGRPGRAAPGRLGRGRRGRRALHLPPPGSRPRRPPTARSCCASSTIATRCATTRATCAAEFWPRSQPIALYDVDETELRGLARNEEHCEMLRALGLRSAIWLPLIARDRVLGVLSAWATATGARRYTARTWH